jgi:hypothetical protein
VTLQSVTLYVWLHLFNVTHLFDSRGSCRGSPVGFPLVVVTYCRDSRSCNVLLTLLLLLLLSMCHSCARGSHSSMCHSCARSSHSSPQHLPRALAAALVVVVLVVATPVQGAVSTLVDRESLLPLAVNSLSRRSLSKSLCSSRCTRCTVSLSTMA